MTQPWFWVERFTKKQQLQKQQGSEAGDRAYFVLTAAEEVKPQWVVAGKWQIFKQLSASDERALDAEREEAAVVLKLWHRAQAFVKAEQLWYWQEQKPYVSYVHCKL